MALGDRSQSAILQNLMDPFYPLVKQFQDVVCNDPPSVLCPDRGVRLEIDLVPGTKHCAKRQWPLPKAKCDVIDDLFRADYAAGRYGSVSLPILRPKFGFKKQDGKWRIVHAYNKLNTATIPTQSPISRKNVRENVMVGYTRFSALDTTMAIIDGSCHPEYPANCGQHPERHASGVACYTPRAVQCPGYIQSDRDAVPQNISRLRTDRL